MATPEPFRTAPTAPGTNDHARTAALAAYAPPQPVSEWVEYNSRGRTLIIGAADDAWPLAKTLAAQLDCVVLATRQPAQAPKSAPPVRTVYGRVRELTGYLGAFELGIETENGDRLTGESAFGPAHAAHDLVLDLDARPTLAVEIPPPGYHHAPDDATRKLALESLPDMVGTFQKPRYFHYDSSICAHGERGLAGCRNCLDACATGAIISLGERIEIDPYLCQGCGSCATSCPTGAVTYALPPAGDLLSALRRLLNDYRNAGGSDPVLVFHAEDCAASVLQQLPGNALPVAVEDIGAIGLEASLTLLAYGTHQILLLAPANTAPSLLETSGGQVDLAGRIIDGLGDAHAAARVQLISEAGVAELGPTPPALVSDHATFAALGNKREIMRAALAHLHRHAPDAAAQVALPASAPFGEIQVDRDACTLCMACVSVCPAAAVVGGGDEPKLFFHEQHCVQCGLCETACPEDAIGLNAQLDFTAHLLPEKRLLNEEPMQHCLDCGTAFATRKMVTRMQEKLSNHWMYKTPKAREMLALCEDCRIHRAFDEHNGVNPHRE